LFYFLNYYSLNFFINNNINRITLKKIFQIAYNSNNNIYFRLNIILSVNILIIMDIYKNMILVYVYHKKIFTNFLLMIHFSSIKFIIISINYIIFKL